MPPVAVPVPLETPSTRIVTVEPASAVPVKVGVLFLVMLSVFEVPVSVAAVMSGVVGAAGGAESSTYVADEVEQDEVLPATSVAVAKKVVVVLSVTETVMPGDANVAALPVPAAGGVQVLFE